MTTEEIEAKRQDISDKAIIAAVKTIAELERAQDLQAYKRHPRISMKWGEDKYSIKLQFAMHLGTAIESCIGSEQKVDALYLSRDAMIIDRIDQLGEIYDRPIIITQSLHNAISDKAQE